MSGYVLKADKGKVYIEVDCSPNAIKAASISQSGKNRLVASSHGFQAIALPDGTQLKISLNVTTPLTVK